MGCSAYNKRRNGAAPQGGFTYAVHAILADTGEALCGVVPFLRQREQKQRYKNYLYIEGMPEDKANVPFYVKHGFRVMENGAAIQICSYSDKR